MIDCSEVYTVAIRACQRRPVIHFEILYPHTPHNFMEPMTTRGGPPPAALHAWARGPRQALRNGCYPSKRFDDLTPRCFESEILQLLDARVDSGKQNIKQDPQIREACLWTCRDSSGQAHMNWTSKLRSSDTLRASHPQSPKMELPSRWHSMTGFGSSLTSGCSSCCSVSSFKQHPATVTT